MDLKIKDLPLVNKAGDSANLEGKKVVGLYFSAHWCPPCRGFTPSLVEWFKEWKASEAADVKDKLEMVFVSFDRDSKSFQEYFNSMEFLAVKYDAEEKQQLGDQYQVSGIPSLIFIRINEDESEEIMSKDGRKLVAAKDNAKIKTFFN